MSSWKKYLTLCCATAPLWLMTGCTPLVNTPGSPVTTARIEQDHFITADGAPLPLRCWLPKAPPRAIIIALHGFNDYRNFFAGAGDYLATYGIASYAYDQRGFGGSPGRGLWPGITAYTDDLTAFSRQLRTRHPGVPLYILGESMGGAITIVAMSSSNRPDVDGVILSAPAVWARETMPWYQRWLLAVASHTVPSLKLTGKGLRIAPSDNSDMLRAFRNDPLVIKGTRVDTLYGVTNLMDRALVQASQVPGSVLVLYGRHDQVIPKEPILKMLDTMPATTRRAFYENGYHLLLRDLHADKPLADIVTWITNHDSPLPNGTDRW